MENRIFDEQLERIKLITGKKTQFELADLLGVKQSSISDAKKRRKIPAGWLVVLMRYKNINPEWILTGNEPIFISSPQPEPHHHVDAATVPHITDEEALRRFSSRILADELVRRIAVSRNKP